MKSFVKLGMASIFLFIIVSGCASRESYHSQWIDNQEKLERNKNVYSAEQFYNSTTREEIEIAFGGPIGDIYKGSSLDIILQKTDNSVTVDVIWKTERFFSLGQYEGFDINRRNEAVAFAALMSQGANHLVQKAKSFGLNARLLATFHGSADAVPIRSSLFYRGEFHKVVLSELTTTLNGKPQSFIIEAGQKLTNAKLAALRAVFMKTVFNAALRKTGFDFATTHFEEKFDIKVYNDKKGKQYRYGRITVSVEEGQE